MKICQTLDNIKKIPENFRKCFSYIYTAKVKRWGLLSKKVENGVRLFPSSLVPWLLFFLHFGYFEKNNSFRFFGFL